MMNLPQLPPRDPDSHKGDYGRAVLMGGSRGMAGAIALSGMAALRGGAGLVRLGVPAACLETVAGFEPCYTTTPLPCDADGRIAATPAEVAELCEAATCVAIGPGLGRSPALVCLVESLYITLSQPLVIDADGLNALAERSDPLAQPAGPRILTPHPGEFLRLARLDRSADREKQIEVARQLARENRVLIVLKGHGTLVTDGSRAEFNSTGNPGMATGGTGDVLTGLITALVCQGLGPFEAARLGCHLHGLAGDLAATARGEISLIARDLIEFLPEAFRRSAAANESIS